MFVVCIRTLGIEISVFWKTEMKKMICFMLWQMWQICGGRRQLYRHGRRLLQGSSWRGLCFIVIKIGPKIIFIVIKIGSKIIFIVIQIGSKIIFKTTKKWFWGSSVIHSQSLVYFVPQEYHNQTGSAIFPHHLHCQQNLLQNHDHIQNQIRLIFILTFLTNMTTSTSWSVAGWKSVRGAV